MNYQLEFRSSKMRVRGGDIENQLEFRLVKMRVGGDIEYFLERESGLSRPFWGVQFVDAPTFFSFFLFGLLD